MFAEWLGWVGNVLPIVLLLPMVWLVAGFLIHSIGADEPVEEKAPSLSGYLTNAVAWLPVAGLWAYMLVEELGDPERNLIWVGVLALGVAGALLRVFLALFGARQMAAQGTSSPRT
jgi:hypothetical protein